MSKATSPGSRLTRNAGDNQPFHLTMLARNKTGYRNLLKLVTSSHLEGYYYRPRMDRDILAKYSEGITVLSGCPSGEIMRLIRMAARRTRKTTARWYREVFDGHYYFEVQEHDLPEFKQAQRVLVELSREMGIPWSRPTTRITSTAKTTTCRTSCCASRRTRPCTKRSG